MITADEARKIVNSKLKDEYNSQLFKYVIDQIERNVKDVSSRGGRRFSHNVNALVPSGKPGLLLRKAIAEKLSKNGFSYGETQRSPNCVWFTISW